MIRHIHWLLLIPLCVGCVTSGDLRNLADEVRAAEDKQGALADGLDALADEVEAREAATREGLSGIEKGGIVGGLATVASMVGTHFVRERRRKLRNEVYGAPKSVTAQPKAQPHQPS